MFRLIHIMVLPKFYNVANPFIYPSGICSSKCWKLDESDTQSNGQWATVDRQNNQWNMYTTRPEQLAYLHIQAHKYTSHKKSYTWKQTDPVSGQEKKYWVSERKRKTVKKKIVKGGGRICAGFCVYAGKREWDLVFLFAIGWVCVVFLAPTYQSGPAGGE